MLMSLKAGNLGLNMIAACHVILLDLWWNPTTEDQAIDRAHRIGQTRPVTVTRITIKDTVEDRILSLQDEKKKWLLLLLVKIKVGAQQLDYSGRSQISIYGRLATLFLLSSGLIHGDLCEIFEVQRHILFPSGADIGRQGCRLPLSLFHLENPSLITEERMVDLISLDVSFASRLGWKVENGKQRSFSLDSIKMTMNKLHFGWPSVPLEKSSELRGIELNLQQILVPLASFTLTISQHSLRNQSINYRRLDGTMSLSARDRNVKDFNTDPVVTVMLMTLKAGNLGLNMIAACHVILLDLWWNPTTEDQAIDRAHRIGHTRPVTVTQITIKDTVEDRILSLQDYCIIILQYDLVGLFWNLQDRQMMKKKMVASAFGEDQSGGSATRLTVEDLRYLFMGD
ncbi:hypothetical protein CRYUN_Cryun04dG0089000 [Craigia yunnanensis]